MEEKRVALCFWGLTRSLNITVDSLKEHILSVLEKNGVKYDIFMHTYYFEGEYFNPFSCERGTLDFEQYKILMGENPDPKFFQKDNQHEIKEKLNVEQYRTFDDPWGNGYGTCDNFILALYSKLQVTNLVRESGIKYDNIMFLRPDVRFLNSLNIDWFSLPTPKHFYIPNFCTFGGLNDRFFLSNYENGLIYGSAFNSLLSYSKIRNIHSETYCYKYLIEMNGLVKIDIPLRFNRVRFTGMEHTEDPTFD